MADNIIVDTATRIFADLCEANTINAAEKGDWPAALWDALEESGSAADLGPGRISAAPARRCSTALPCCGSRGVSPRRCRSPRLARRLAAGAGQDHRAGRPDDDRAGARGRQHRDRRRRQARSAARATCPFARNASTSRSLAGRAAASRSSRWSPTDAVWRSTPATSFAGEPRDDASPSTAPRRSRSSRRPASTRRLVLLGAAARAQQMAGALEHILDQSVQFSLDRVQFGRPIAKFQAVQHNLASARRRGRRRRRPPPMRAAEAIATYGVAGDAPSPRPRSPSCGSARPPAPAPRSRIRCTARWALPTSTRCTTRRAGCGRGARNSATRRYWAIRSATWSPRGAPTRCGRS